MLKRCSIVASLLLTCAIAFAPSAGATPTLTWGDAQNVPGLSTLANGGASTADLVECIAVDTCALGGWYSPSQNVTQAYTAPFGGGLGNAVPETDVAALNTGGDAGPDTVACAAIDICVLAGTYSPSPGVLEGWVRVESPSGVTTGPIPGLSALNIGGFVNIYDSACTSGGYCVVVGSYRGPASMPYPFILEVAGGVAQTVLSFEPIFPMGGEFISVSCWADGECVAAGLGISPMGPMPITMERTAGAWGNPAMIGGLSLLGSGTGYVLELECVAGPNCVALGAFDSASGASVFSSLYDGVVWTDAVELNGLGALNTNYATVDGLSCAPGVGCAATGHYSSLSGGSVWVSANFGSGWEPAQPLPGYAALDTDHAGNAHAIDCASDGLCVIAGNYGANGEWQGFVSTFSLTDPSAAFDTRPIPGLEAMNVGGYGDPKAVSCVVGGCAVVGFYRVDPQVPNSFAAFVVQLSTTEPVPPTTTTTTGEGATTPTFTG